VMERLNERFRGELGFGQRFTMVYGVLDLESERFTFANAGHPPLFRLCADATVETLDAFGLSIGLASEQDNYEQESIDVHRGDRLVLYSDGVTDAVNEKGELFGDSRLNTAIVESASEPLGAGIEALVNRIKKWRGAAPMNDDVTVLALGIS